MRTAAAALLMAALAGCAGTPLPIPPAKLEKPSPRVMKAPEPLPPDLKAGDDLFDEHGKLRAMYGRETGKLKALQAYVRKIHKETTP